MKKRFGLFDATTLTLLVLFAAVWFTRFTLSTVETPFDASQPYRPATNWDVLKAVWPMGLGGLLLLLSTIQLFRRRVWPLLATLGILAAVPVPRGDAALQSFFLGAFLVALGLIGSVKLIIWGWRKALSNRLANPEH